MLLAGDSARVVMLDHQHDRAVEIGIQQVRRCDKQLTAERRHGRLPFSQSHYTLGWELWEKGSLEEKA